ncbi:MAG: putative metal-binding motif-containing protein, partial [Pseudomonadota bacterium]
PDPEPEPDLIPDFIPDREINLDHFVDYISIDDEFSCIDRDSDDVCYEADCDDDDPNNWDSCDTCADGDRDGWFVLCDAYVTISGPDCDDSSGSRFPGNPEVCDGIDNDCDSAGDDGLTCITATNGGATYYLNVVPTHLCIDVFCDYDYDGCRCIPTPLDIRQRDRTVIAIVDSSCDGMFLAVLHDAMGGGGGDIDGTITNDPGSAFTDEELLVDDYWGEDPCDYYASTYFECDWGWSSSWGGDGMCAGFYVSNACITFDFYNSNDMDGISLYDGATGTYTDFAYTPDVTLCIQTVPDAS